MVQIQLEWASPTSPIGGSPQYVVECGNTSYTYTEAADRSCARTHAAMATRKCKYLGTTSMQWGLACLNEDVSMYLYIHMLTTGFPPSFDSIT